MPITTTLQANALTTLDVVLDELGLVSDGGVVDSRLNRFINVASDFLARECGRAFAKSAGIVENVAGWKLPTTIRLKRRPILAVTSIVYMGQAYDMTGIAIVDDGAGLVMRRSGFPWTAAADPGISRRQVAGTEFPDLTVTYDGGYVTPKQLADATFTPRTLPSDLEDACVQLVTGRYQRKGVDTRVTARSFEASGYTFGGLPVAAEVAAIIENYRDIPNA